MTTRDTEAEYAEISQYTAMIGGAVMRAYLRGVTMADMAHEADKWARAYLRRCKNLRHVSEAVSVRRALKYKALFLRFAPREYWYNACQDHDLPAAAAYLAYGLYHSGPDYLAPVLCLASVQLRRPASETLA